MKIIKYPNPILNQVAEPVIIDDEFKALCKEVEDYCDKIPSFLGMFMGLALPQLGISKRAFVLKEYIDERNIKLGRHYVWYINPEITWTPKGPKNMKEEGCYSLTNSKFDYKIERYYAIKLKWQDLSGNWHEEKFKNVKGQVVQHEFDHLNGLLCNHEEEARAERMTAQEWAHEFGFKITDFTGFEDADAPITEQEFRIQGATCVAERLPDYDKRKRRLE